MLNQVQTAHILVTNAWKSRENVVPLHSTLNIQHSNTMNTEERYISLLDKNTHRVFNDKVTFEEAEIAKFNAEEIQSLT